MVPADRVGQGALRRRIFECKVRICWFKGHDRWLVVVFTRLVKSKTVSVDRLHINCTIEI